MSACPCATLACTAVLIAPLVSGANNAVDSREAGRKRAETSTSRGSSSESKVDAAAMVTEAAARGPLLHPWLSERVASRVDSAIPVAQEHLRDNPSCQALFTRLGADGVGSPWPWASHYTRHAGVSHSLYLFRQHSVPTLRTSRLDEAC